MSRLQHSNTTAKYNISSPQPIVSPEIANPSSSSFRASSSRADAQPKVSANGSPIRPARSRMREQVAQPSSRINLAPITTHSGRTADLPISPISPVNAEPPSLFSDPFAADRSQRTELRAQTKAVTQTADASREKLRNVVGAFIAAGKPKTEPKRPTRHTEDDLFSDPNKFSEINTVLHRIKNDWPFVLESDFSASTLSLSLLGSSRLEHFIEIHNALSTALQASVQAHFQSFAASLPAHANFLATLGRAQSQIRASKIALKEARDGFGAQGKTELAGIRARERQVRDMLQVLDTIETLKQSPDRLETLIGDKKFLVAANLLVDNLKTINKPEIYSIGATADLRAYFVSQESILCDILIEELHSQLYLKTFDSDTRLRSDQRLEEYLATIDDAPEGSSDAFSYMQKLLEALSVLGKLGSALETIAQRAPSEIHILIETTLDEVEERSDQLEDEPAAPSLAAISSPRHTAILKDLTCTIYAKLAAVLEGHRVVYEVSRWISTRRDFKDSMQKSPGTLTIPVLEVWKPIQQEVRTILQSYLVDEAVSSLDRQAVTSVNDILRDGQLQRDRQKVLFRFGDTDLRAVNQEYKSTDEAIHSTLKSTLPGLTSGQDSTEDGAANGRHRTLIPVNSFNVTTLFEPTVNFINRAAAIAPPGFETEPRAFGAVLEDFVVQVFLPQLDERVTASFQNAVSGYDAYQLETRVNLADRPPLRSSVRVMDLIHSLCFMLQAAPFHRENYSRLIVGVIVQYYQQCSARFKELVNSSQAETVLPAQLAQREDLIACLTDVRAVLPSDHNESILTGQREIRLEADLTAQVVETQLINSKRKIEALCQLSQSLRWYIDALLDIQEVSEEILAPTVEPRLPLTRAMSQRFEAIIQTYEQLTEMILNTVRLDIRCRVICNINAAFKTGDLGLDSEALEPDPDIVDLADHLIQYDSLSQRTLSIPDHQFIFRGLFQLVDHLIIHNAQSVKVVNQAGAKKIRRNILSLQQTLRAIQDSEGILSRSLSFWDLYDQGPKKMLESLRTSKPMFTFDDYNAMLNLQCKTEANQAASSELNTYLIDLHALSMSIDGWEIGEG